LIRPRLLAGCLVAALAVLLHLGPRAAAQERSVPDLRLPKLPGLTDTPGSLRDSTTESWSAFSFDLLNLTDQDRQARVVVLYEGQPDVQYGRDVWIPARSLLKSWMLVGPAPPQVNPETNKPLPRRDLQVLLYDRSGGKEVLVPPRSQEPLRKISASYRKREQTTTVLIDEGPLDPMLAMGELPRPDIRAKEALLLARTFRLTRDLSEAVSLVNAGPLPPVPEAFDGIDHFVIASNRIASDPIGLRALRQWVQRGGKVWVMLDMIELDTIAPLLGDALDFEVVDRVGLTRFEILTHGAGQAEAMPIRQQHERPVELVRVLLPAAERPRHTVDGWPIWFTRRVGRGKVVFTTLGARGWYRPRGPRDGRARFENFPDIPVPHDPLNEMGDVLQLTDEESLSEKTVRAALDEEIGYSVASRGVAGLIFGAFLFSMLGLGIALRRSRRPELVGWLAPVAALATAGGFLALGESSRRAVPATVAVVQVVDAGLDGREAAVRGTLAMYRPYSGPAEVGASQGGLFELDAGGLQGQVRRQIVTDLDAWHMEGLSLPADKRQAPFRYTAATPEPIAAVAHFGPEGVEGKLKAGPFEELADALLTTVDGRSLAVQLRRDGSFRADPADVLPPGQFVASTLMSDQQKQRQDMYRDYLKRPLIGRRTARSGGVGATFMVWAKPIDMHFTLVPEARRDGMALLVIPLQVQSSIPGQRVTIPGPFSRCRRRHHDGVLATPPSEGNAAADMHLRFQLPAAVLPLTIERVRFLARIDAPSRRVTVSGRQADGGLIEVKSVDSPLDPIDVKITDQRLLWLDEEGGLHLNVALSGMLKGEGGSRATTRDEKWIIQYLEIEVTGVTK
jgi:hypothetical protein